MLGRHDSNSLGAFLISLHWSRVSTKKTFVSRKIALTHASQPPQRQLQPIDHRGHKGQIQRVNRVAHLVVVRVPHEGGVGHHQGVVAAIPERAVVATAHRGNVMAGTQNRKWFGGDSNYSAILNEDVPIKDE